MKASFSDADHKTVADICRKAGITKSPVQLEAQARWLAADGDTAVEDESATLQRGGRSEARQEVLEDVLAAS